MGKLYVFFRKIEFKFYQSGKIYQLLPQVFEHVCKLSLKLKQRNAG